MLTPGGPLMTRFDRRGFILLALPLALALVLGGSLGEARADLPKKVIAAFKGKILVTKAPLEAGGEDDKATIARFKKEQLTEVVGAQNADDAWEWSFTYT